MAGLMIQTLRSGQRSPSAPSPVPPRKDKWAIEENIDILAFLEQVMLKNIHSYQSDFQYDIARLRDATLESDPERRTFYWMSRLAGIWLVTERDTFLRGSNGHTIWTHYA